MYLTVIFVHYSAFDVTISVSVFDIYSDSLYMQIAFNFSLLSQTNDFFKNQPTNFW